MVEPTFSNYEEASAYQLSEWLAGRPWHNPFSADGSYGETRRDGECCPDFSCCRPSNLAPLRMRKVFVNGGRELRSSLSHDFLCTMINVGGSDSAYVAAEPTGATH